ncbi:MAG: hypothetical protein BVN28_12940 [Nitrospira sp. ST-bin4]|nr:MAG: hypothetical protein BVN28_12940 [Nitrospira sp. ST-bin4]
MASASDVIHRRTEEKQAAQSLAGCPHLAVRWCESLCTSGLQRRQSGQPLQGCTDPISNRRTMQNRLAPG